MMKKTQDNLHTNKTLDDSINCLADAIDGLHVSDRILFQLGDDIDSLASANNRLSDSINDLVNEISNFYKQVRKQK